jgi:DNA-binding MarR family transcriptional regulator
MNDPAPWERLLSPNARRALSYLREVWRSRDAGSDKIIVTFDDFVGSGLVTRAAVRRSIDRLVDVGLIERSDSVRGKRGHPRNAFRVLEKS